MTKRMLIDATHAEETRVVVLDGNRLEDFDVETAAKKQLKGNIYLAKVVRVEPSLQAAFVEYGGGRHGFLAFSEIHPDYYQIPVADRQRLLELQEAEARAEEEAEDAAAEAEARGQRSARPAQPAEQPDEPSFDELDGGAEEFGNQVDALPTDAADMPIIVAAADEDAGFEEDTEPMGAAPSEPVTDEPSGEPELPPGVEPEFSLGVEPPLPMEETAATSTQAAAIAQDFVYAREEAADIEDAAAAAEGLTGSETLGTDMVAEATLPGDQPAETMGGHEALIAERAEQDAERAEATAAGPHEPFAEDAAVSESNGQGQEADEAELAPAEPPPETVGGARPDGSEDEPREARAPNRFMRSYKIQEVIRRRQILLIQVVKEERGSKGAALTTYVSLAGRFSVLMPNSPRGGGISRKITSAADRRRLKEVTAELQIPRGMGMIVRTAGANRPKAEIKRDCEYLLELWDSIRETTMASIAPALIHEEANLIKRAIRDNYSRDVEEVLVDGEQGWRAARDFMRMLMPAHARKVILWNDPQPLFARQQVEAQLDAMLVPTVQLKSGGYLVINQTEALVAIDVNSGRSTRERGIEETALKTNLEAADEVARQLRLRDLAGLIVIDFIDMESRRNNAAGREAAEGRAEGRPRPHPDRLHQPFRPDGDEPAAAAPVAGGDQLHRLPALRRHRAGAHDRDVRAGSAARDRGRGRQAPGRRDRGARGRRGGAVCAEPQAGAPGRDRGALRHDGRVRRRREPAAAADPHRPHPGADPGEAPVPAPMPIRIAAEPPAEDDLVEEEADEVDGDNEAPALAAGPSVAEVPGETAEEGAQRKRRRRRRGGRREEGAAPRADSEGDAETGVEAAAVDPSEAEQPNLDLPEAASDSLVSDGPAPGVAPAELDMDAAAGDDSRGRRRGRRGGRRRRRDSPEDGEAAATGVEAAETGDGEQVASFDEPAVRAPRPAYVGPTPADPFGGGDVFDIFELAEQAEAQRAAAPPMSAMPDPQHGETPTQGAGEYVEPAHAAEPAIAEPTQPEPVAAQPAPPEPDQAIEPELSLEPGHTPEPGPIPEPEHTAEPEHIPEPPHQAAQVEPELPLQNGHAAEPEAVAAAPTHQPEPDAASAESGPTSVPAPPPVLVGESPAEKRRGWWRR